VAYNRRRMSLLLPLLIGLWQAAPAPAVWSVQPGASRVVIHVGRAGLFKFAGHEHEVEAPVREGRVVAPAAGPARAEVSLSFRAADLRVTGRGEPPDDVPKVQAAMVGPKVLDAERFPTISFASSAVSGRPAGAGAWDVTVEGRLTLHGVTRDQRLALRVEVAGDRLHAAGRAVLRQTDFGIRPVSVAGVVKVKDELEIEFDLVARPAKASE